MEQSNVEEQVNPEEGMNLEDLLFVASQPDLLEYLSDERVDELGVIAKDGYDIDHASLTEWRDELKKIRDMANSPKAKKTYPWPGASNVRYPLIISSAWQFNARAYPAIVNMGTPVLAKVIGSDENSQKQLRADRVSRHMSWQLTEEMTEWDEDMDRLLLTLPIDGCVFKKIYFDENLTRNVSEMVICDNLVVNANTMDLASCPRISQRFSLYPHEIKERINSGDYRDVEDNYGVELEDERDQTPINFIEQHTYIDLDGDGYPEPYIITCTEDEGTVARISANFTAKGILADEEGNVVAIKPIRYFVKYECFPDPSGCYYGKGFGALLLPLNDSVDSTINMLLDAAHLANTGGGFVANQFRLESGSLKFTPGKWQKVDTAGFPMKDAIMPLPVPDPSPVLFQLLGMLIESAKEIGSTQDVMTGGAPGANTPATTTLAIIEQGMKVYTAIFKRIYRAMKAELDLLFILNATHVDPGVYKTILDTDLAVAEQDYSLDDLDIAPAADPASATDIQKAAKAQILMQFYGSPTANNAKIMTDALRAGGIAEPEKYLIPEQEGPSAEEIQAMEELRIKEMEAKTKRLVAVAEAYEAAAGAIKKMTEASAEGGQPMPMWADLSEIMSDLIKGSTENANPVQEPGGLPAMEGEQPMAMDPAGGPPGGIAGPGAGLR
jgi:chaperonin GroES